MPDKFANSKVKELKGKNLKVSGSSVSVKGNKKKGIVLFYYDWCGYCNLMAPEYKKLASKNSSLSIYAINGTDPTVMSAFKAFKIESVPALYMLSANGKINKSKQFFGERNMEEMKKFANAITGGKVVKRRPKKKVVKKAPKKKVVKKKCGCGMKCVNGKCKVVKRKVVKRKVVKRKVVKRKVVKKKVVRKARK